MRSTSWFGQALMVVVLLAAGAILWRTSEAEHRLAAAERDLVTLRYQEAANQAQGPGRLANLLPGNGRLAADAKALETTAAYWQGDYQVVTSDVDARLLAANAAYRTARKGGGTWQAMVGKLDSVVKSYAEIVRDQPGNAEAVFNYEHRPPARGPGGAQDAGRAVRCRRHPDSARLRRRAARRVGHEEVQDDCPDAA